MSVLFCFSRQDDSLTDHKRKEGVEEILGKMSEDRFHKVTWRNLRLFRVCSVGMDSCGRRGLCSVAHGLFMPPWM